MLKLNISPRIKSKINDFLSRLKDAYADGLVSVVLYGSAASGEYVDRHSNLNFLIVLKNTDCESLAKASGFINKFPNFRALFMTEHYIETSSDIFPIEFLDLRENNWLLAGKDCLSGIQVDTKNLRFQCEQELKIKLLTLRNTYLRIRKNKAALRELLFRSITSILHISRNVLRLKGRQPVYRKEDIIRELAVEFQIDAGLWQKILTGKNKASKITDSETEKLFADFVREVERLTDIVDML